MRWIVLVLGVLGGLLAAALGITWISDYNRLQATVRELSSAGADLSALSGLVRAAYVLLVGAVLGLAGGAVALRGQGRLAAGLLLVCPIVAAVMTPKSLVGSFLLILAGGLALLVRPPVQPAA
ncbi:MAG: hypothetical protein A3H96_22270 [Acidobacteria bacterium RIFCSPLOWO2_02_FULL_67_36]|nr:MAG: hypothetical protein A3H96_22270 [Acidobacteria bacterium RIFCSPLOWO2_02_FULL_67_36]OFW20281.1 MAG: hypothetical protein A3G21_26840 [Acidobacteria bacterium RIFCSPLOWO2_12_FULL_66_21]